MIYVITKQLFLIISIYSNDSNYTDMTDGQSRHITSKWFDIAQPSNQSFKISAPMKFSATWGFK